MVLVVFALLHQRLVFAVGGGQLHGWENVQAVGGDFFGIGEIVVVGQIGIKCGTGIQMRRGVYPYFMGVGHAGCGKGADEESVTKGCHIVTFCV